LEGQDKSILEKNIATLYLLKNDKLIVFFHKAPSSDGAFFIFVI